MRPTRPRITVRRLLVLVALAGIGLGLGQRWAGFRRLARHHAAEALQCELHLSAGLARMREGDPVEEAMVRARLLARRRMWERQAADHERLSRYYQSRW